MGVNWPLAGLMVNWWTAAPFHDAAYNAVLDAFTATPYAFATDQVLVPVSSVSAPFAPTEYPVILPVVYDVT